MPSQKSVLKSYSKALIETQGSHTKSKALISLNPRSQTPPPSTLKPKAQKHPRSQPEAQIPKIEFLRHHAIAHHQIENSRFFQACIDSCQAFARSELREMFCPGLSAIAAVECRSWVTAKIMQINLQVTVLMLIFICIGAVGEAVRTELTGMSKRCPAALLSSNRLSW